MRIPILFLFCILLGIVLCGCGASGAFEGSSVSVTVAPSSANVVVGGTQTFTAAVTGSPNTSVTWSVEESTGGMISSTGVYTALTSAGTYHVIATSNADPTKFGIAPVVVGSATNSVVGITISPLTLTLPPAGTQQFGALVTGTANTAVTWSVTETGGGSITSGGVYTAPATAGTYHVVATSQANTARQSTATVIVATGATARVTINVVDDSNVTPPYAFLPATVTSGTTVDWYNSSQATHGITWDAQVPSTSPGPSAGIATFKPGTVSLVWTAPTLTTQTVYHYHCSVHGVSEAGTITVNP